MTATMKAAVVHAFDKPLDIRDVEKPDVLPGKIRVKIEASGVCHTDLHAARGDWPVRPQPPFMPGHEGVGVVDGVGAGVTAVKEGDRVGVPCCTRPAAIAAIARPAGKPFAPTSRTPATASMAASPNMCWPIRTMSDACRTAWHSMRQPLCFAPALPSTKA